MKVGHNTEFHFGIYWWTWKTNAYLKSCWSGSIKNKMILIFTMLHIFLKNKEKHLEISLFYTCVPKLDDMIYGSWQIELDRLKLVILGLFCPFTPLKTQKTKILKNGKKCWRCHHSLYVHQKSQLYDVWFLRYGVW